MKILRVITLPSPDLHEGSPKSPLNMEPWYSVVSLQGGRFFPNSSQ